MSATATVTSLLAGTGFDSDALRRACDELELEIQEFDAWQDGNDSTPMGCICFRVPDTEEVA